MDNYNTRIRFSDVKLGQHFGSHDDDGGNFHIYQRIFQESNGGNALWLGLKDGQETVYRFNSDEIVYVLGESKR